MTLRIRSFIYSSALIITFLWFSFLTTNLLAQESSASAEPSPASNSAVTAKIEDLKKEIASKAADLKAEMDRKIGNKVYTGKISGVSVDTISVDAELGSRSIRVDEYTVFQDQSTKKSKKALTLGTLTSGDTIIALGEVDEKSLMTAKKIIRTDAPKPRSFSYVLGQLTKVEPRQITLRTKAGAEQVIGFHSKSVIRNGKDEGKVDDLKLTRNVIAVFEKDEATKSGMLYILPAGGLKTLGVATKAAEVQE